MIIDRWRRMARRLPTRAWSGEPGKLLHWPAGAGLGHRCSGGIARLVTRAADHPEPVERWMRVLLHDASQPNAGQRLSGPQSSAPGSGPRWRCAPQPAGRPRRCCPPDSRTCPRPGPNAGAPGTPAGTLASSLGRLAPTTPRSPCAARCERAGRRNGTLNRRAQARPHRPHRPANQPLQ